MKIVGIIPSRYNSTRFPGKALAALGSRPMLAYVCEAALACSLLDEVYVATDSPKIKEVCDSRGVSVIMTKESHLTPTSRVWEAAGKVDADLYIMIGGDEPLISPNDIKKVVETAVSLGCSSPDAKSPDSKSPAPFIVNAMTAIRESEALNDPSNFKLAYNKDLECLYLSRNPVPHQKSGPAPCYMKFVSIGAYTKESLDFFASAPPGILEQAEECDLLRFLEYRRRIILTDIGSPTLSVDTPADLERAGRILTLRGEL